MSIIVSDDGFAQDDREVPFINLDELCVSDTAGHAIDIANDMALDDLAEFLDQISLIRVAFPSFADGRGFSIAARLRLMGYKGHLRAAGHILPDQYPNARRCGFDDLEIDEFLAARQPESQWLARAGWAKDTYQSRLRKVS